MAKAEQKLYPSEQIKVVERHILKIHEELERSRGWIILLEHSFTEMCGKVWDGNKIVYESFDVESLITPKAKPLQTPLNRGFQ